MLHLCRVGRAIRLRLPGVATSIHLAFRPILIERLAPVWSAVGRICSRFELPNRLLDKLAVPMQAMGIEDRVPFT